MLFIDHTNDRYVIDHNVNTIDIAQYFRAAGGPEVSLFEFGIDNLRFDLIKISCWNRRIRIFEFKQSRNDFLNDKKWKKYLPYCHTLTFVCPAQIIDKNDLPKGIGLFNVFYWQHKYGSAKRLGGIWIKRPRSIGKPTERILTHIAFTAVSKFPHRDYWK